MTDNELVKAEREKELVECLAWLQHRMDEYDDKEAYQDDYKMASIAWNFIRARMAENAELKEAQRWRTMDEKPPTLGTRYFVRIAGVGADIAFYSESGNWCTFDEYLNDDVECWQPLPQPPEKG